MSNILQFKNQPPENEFAPVYNYYIYESYLGNVFDFNEFKNLILKKEKEIVNTYPAYSDGDTGLGCDSLTSRFKYFNLFDWPEMINLKMAVKSCHSEFLFKLGIDDKPVYAQCWANVLRKGQHIKKHRHGTNSFGYLGGHVCVSANNTSTHYENPFTEEIYSSVNQPGKITFFPSFLAHYTDTVTCDQERITIAFDLYTETGWKEDVIDSMKSHWVKL
jgi:hypothetical protein